MVLIITLFLWWIVFTFWICCWGYLILFCWRLFRFHVRHFWKIMPLLWSFQPAGFQRGLVCAWRWLGCFGCSIFTSVIFFFWRFANRTFFISYSFIFSTKSNGFFESILPMNSLLLMFSTFSSWSAEVHYGISFPPLFPHEWCKDNSLDMHDEGPFP